MQSRARSWTRGERSRARSWTLLAAFVACAALALAFASVASAKAEVSVDHSRFRNEGNEENELARVEIGSGNVAKGVTWEKTEAAGERARGGDGSAPRTKASSRKKSKRAMKKAGEEEEMWKPVMSEIEEGESPAGSLHEAIDDDDMDELEDLLKWKPNLREKCQKLGETKGYSPIMKAAFKGNARAMDLLIDYGANVNEVDSLGYSVLMRSVLAKSLPCVKLLVDAGAVVNYVQKTPIMDMGLSALKIAELMREKEIVNVLREAGADEGESGSEKRRRMAKEQGDVFRGAVEESGIDVDVDKLLSTTVEDLMLKSNSDLDVTVHHNGTNTTVKQTEQAQKYVEMAAKMRGEKQANSDQGAEKCSAGEDDGGSCAFDADAASSVKDVKDEL